MAVLAQDELGGMAREDAHSVRKLVRLHEGACHVCHFRRHLKCQNTRRARASSIHGEKSGAAANVEREFGAVARDSAEYRGLKGRIPLRVVLCASTRESGMSTGQRGARWTQRHVRREVSSRTACAQRALHMMERM